MQRIGVQTVRDVYNNRQFIANKLGNHGKQIIELADGIDNRAVAAAAQSQSLGKEQTFQRDIMDFDYLKDVLRLTARELSFEIRLKGLYCRTVTLKATYKDMKKITRSKSGDPINKALDIYNITAALLDKIEKRPVRLVGISLSGFTDMVVDQLSLLEPDTVDTTKMDSFVTTLQRKYGMGIVKTGSELISEKHVKNDQDGI